MPRDSEGLYTLPEEGVLNPVIPDTIITADWANTTLDDIALALTESIATNGDSIVTANIPMNGYRFSGLGDATLRTQSINAGQVQDGVPNKLILSVGTNSMVGAMLNTLPTTLVDGFEINFFVISPAPTGAVTININGRGAISLIKSNGTQVGSGDLSVDDYITAYWTGTEFKIRSQSSSAVTSTTEQASISGWDRPLSPTTYPLLAIDGTEITVPEGSGKIVTAGDNPTVTSVSWAEQNVVITNLATAFTTTLTVDVNGDIIQYAGRLSGDVYRTHIILGVVEHMDGTVTNVSTNPMIFSDDGYRQVDMTYPLVNQLTAGGKVSRAVLLTLTNTVGYIAVPGASSDDSDLPNQLEMPANATITFNTLTGTDDVVTGVTNSPVGFYDPAGAGGAPSALAAGDAAIHRLYYMWGTFVWAYGQTSYADKDAALAKLLLDRSTYIPSSYLSDATLICEIIAEEGTLDMVNAYFINRTGADGNIGAVAGLSDAPSDGDVYGRKNGTWFVTPTGTSAFTTNVSVTKTEPTITLTNTDNANFSGYYVKRASTANLYGMLASFADLKTYFRGYTSGGAVTFSTSYDLVTGAWIFPSSIQAVTGTIGTITSTIGNYGTINGTIGTIGTINSTIGNIGTIDSTIGTIDTLTSTSIEVDTITVTNIVSPSIHPNIVGLELGISGASTQAFEISSGSCADVTGLKTITLGTGLVKFGNAIWQSGGTGGTPKGCLPTGFSLVNNGLVYYAFALGSEDGTLADFGLDTDVNATNLLATGAITTYLGANWTYRQIGWLPWGYNAPDDPFTPGVLTNFINCGDEVVLTPPLELGGEIGYATASAVEVSVCAPPSPVSMAKVGVSIRMSSGTNGLWVTIASSIDSVDYQPTLTRYSFGYYRIGDGNTTVVTCPLSVPSGDAGSGRANIRVRTTNSVGAVPPGDRYVVSYGWKWDRNAKLDWG